MKIPFVDLHSQYLTLKPEIDKAIQNVIDTTSFINGTDVKKFENKFSTKIGSKHCISVANGTDAIYIVLKMLNIGNGDEVITTASSWISTSETITQAGAKPIFVDIDDYYTIDFEKIEEKITNKTKAIIVVHLYGQSANLEKIQEITNKYNLFLIEDCAQSHFTKFKDKNVGTFGIASTLGTLKYSRSHETEADKMGLIFAAMGGYDPEVAVGFWERMAAGGGQKPPELLSTHPSDETRIRDLKAFMPEAKKYYKPQ